MNVRNARNASTTQLSGLKQSLSTFWSERNKREQNMLLAAIAVIVLGLIYVLFIDPAISGRSEMAKKLPALRQQAAEVQALARESSTAARKNAGPVTTMTKESVEAALAGKGLKPQSVTVTGEMAKVQLNSVSFAGITDWLADMQRSARVSVVDAKVEALTQPDMVNASFTLRQQKSEQ